jgi:hypothetical protein
MLVYSKEVVSYDTLTWMTLPVRRIISTPTVGLSEVSQLASEDGFQVVRRNRKRVTPEDGRGSGGTAPSSPKVMLQSSTKNISFII